MSVSIAAPKLVAYIAMIVFGAYCLIYSIRGKEFYPSNLVARRPTKRLHPWFARPMFFVMGIFWIYAAVAYFRQELWH